MAQFTFNAREVEPDQGSIGAIPAGWYKTMVKKTEVKPTENGSGQYIAVQMEVLEGSYKGANIFTNFNVVNNSEKAVEIGRKQLSALCHAVNVLEMTDTDQLKNIPFFTRVKLTPAVMDEQDPNKVKYQEKNETNGFRNINDQAAVSAAAKTAADAAAKTGAAPAAAQQRPAAPPMQPQQQYQPPVQPQMQPQPQYQAPVHQPVAQPQFQAPQQQFQAPQQQMQQPVPQQAPAGQPAWAAMPEQPWGAAPAAQPQAGQPQQPPMTPEQQQQFQATMAAAPPWGAPQ